MDHLLQRFAGLYCWLLLPGLPLMAATSGFLYNALPIAQTPRRRKARQHKGSRTGHAYGTWAVQLRDRPSSGGRESYVW